MPPLLPAPHVLVVDDEALARRRLLTLLGDYQNASGQPLHLHEAEGAEAALQTLHTLRHHATAPTGPLIALLDVQMPGTDGMKLAHILHGLPQPPHIIFVTAHIDYAPQAFEVDALAYLPKPVRPQQLHAALDKVLGKYHAAHQNAPVLEVRERGQTLALPLGQIAYCRAEQKYVTLRTPTRTFITDHSLNELEARYPGQWLRIHRNALVQPAYIRSLVRDTNTQGEAWLLHLHGLGESLPVSRRQLANVRAALNAPGLGALPPGPRA